MHRMDDPFNQIRGTFARSVRAMNRCGVNGTLSHGWQWLLASCSGRPWPA
jgi:hypothetical protein